MLVWGLCQPVFAQLSDSARVSLITIAPGQAIYSLWGHSAIRVFDPAQDLDIAFNYGTFDYGSSVAFLAKFAYGRMDYMLSVQSYPALVDDAWFREGRQVVEQVLSLNGVERDSIFSFLSRNALPENRTYRYDYFLDNCSTRIRDVLESVLADSAMFEGPTGVSYRRLVQPYTQALPVLNLLLNLGLGFESDNVPSARGRLFLPNELMSRLDSLTINRSGTDESLVASKHLVYGPGDPVRHTGPIVPIAWLICCLGIALSARSHRIWRYIDAMLLAGTSAVGLIIAFLWFISLHDVAGPNLQLLWAWPTHAYFAWYLLRTGRRASHRRYFLAAATVTLVAALATLFTTMPGTLPPILLFVSVRWAACAEFLVPRTGFEPVLPA